MAEHDESVLTALRPLGSSPIRISALGLGCWQFSKGKGLVGGYWPAMRQDEVREIVRMSLEGGINWFDTAEIYGGGASEDALAEALDEVGDAGKNAVIATKWWPMFRTAGSIRRTIGERSRRLHGRPIDLYQIHQPYSFSGVAAEMKAMAALLREGRIRAAGVSNYSAAGMRAACEKLAKEGFPLVSNQVKYSLLDRRAEKNGTIAAAKELGITIIAYSPLEQGLLSGKYHREPELLNRLKGPRRWMGKFKPAGLARIKPLIDLLERLAPEYGASPGQLALNWLIHYHGDTVVAIPGASKPRHVEENIGAIRFRLSGDHMEEIDRASRLVQG